MKRDIARYLSGIDPYKGLANCIVIQACEDYLNNVITENSFKFFCFGEWIQMLTDVDGECIYNEMKGKKDDSEGNKSKN